jgi:hypothetical protein
METQTISVLSTRDLFYNPSTDANTGEQKE